MGNVFLRNSEAEAVRHFQYPQHLLRSGVYPQLSPSARDLYVGVLYEAHRLSSPEVQLSAAQLKELVGLSANSVTAARKQLAALGLVTIQGNTYTLTDPANGIALPSRATQLELLRTPKTREEKTPRVVRTYARTIFHRSRGENLAFFGHKQRLGTSLTDNGKDWTPCQCPFHADRNPSMSINLNAGTWKCHNPNCRSNDPGIRHSILGFEMLWSNCHSAQAAINVANLMGCGLDAANVWQADSATYCYCDEGGNVLYRVHRSVKKGFRVSHPSADGGTIWNRRDVRLVPYALPSVQTADTCVICEGEKDCDSLNSLNLADENGVATAASCNPFGAGKWKDEYSPYFAGKTVIVVADRDEAGSKHAADVCRSLSGYAASVRRVDFSESEGKDLSEYLDSHSVNELIGKLGLEQAQCKA